jgi:cytochrome c-type biogenesis protein CcmH/NrfG
MDLSDRIQALERETSENPDHVEGWIQLGNAYFDTDQYEKAIAAYRKSLAIDPKNPNVWTDMGVMYRRRGEPQKAVEAFDQAAEMDPKHEISRFNKGIVLLHDLKDMEGAVKVWEDVLRINPFARAPNGQPLMELVTRVREGKT